jgi:eukaryotic-like serine/threonine-protein kinase
MTPLSSDRWRVLSPYLDEALDIATDERPAWLAAIGARDPSLAADLSRLLAEHQAVHDSRFLEHAIPGAPPPAATQSLVGQVLGAYRLISLIGQGGMGTVWLAERCDGRFEGRAAVKLLHVARMDSAGEERFRREGNILARLTHPHIARLIDAGVSPIGQPFLVLEHVDGQTIDRYCVEHALGIEARLRLFLDVLEAVAHAHSNLIVHRDIKPANVLVSVDGHVKLLDFGIAKLLEDDARWAAISETGALTREGGVAFTPEFAAPEQLASGQVTTATDVYALGVLLYTLLTGQHPAGAAVRSTATLIRSIVDEEPRRMSDTVAGKSRRILRGDLDTIVAKALKKNALQRYSSVTALADDLRRFLRHEPISARPDTLRYRAARFVRRHVQGVAASAAVVVLLAGLTAFHTTRLAAERDRAQREAAKAAKVSELMIGVVTGADPIANRATREGPTVRGLLDAAADKVETELVGEPELQADIFTVFGRVYRRLGVYDRAQYLLEEALVSGRTAFGAEHLRVAQTLNDLGALLAERGDYKKAQDSLEASLEMRRKLLGTEHGDVAITLVELGRVYQDQGFNDRAAPLHREALAIRRRVLGVDHRETATSLSDVASVFRLNGDLAAAESLIQQSLELNRKTRGADHPNTGINLHDLGLIAAARGDHPTAEWLCRQALDIHRKALGDKHPVVATILNSLSHVLVKQRRYDEAASALRQALDIARPALGHVHQLVAIYTINLASVELARNKPAAAEALIREALPIRERAPGIVPMRRRIFPEDDWSIAATKRLLEASLAAQRR